MAKTCKSGYILRKGYTRKAYTKKTGTHVAESVVSASCIPDVGSPGKGVPGIGKLKKGELTELGYSTEKSDRSRHIAINVAVKKYGPLSVYRKLNAVAVYTRKTSPEKSKIFLKDRAYIGEKHGFKP